MDKLKEQTNRDGLRWRLNRRQKQVVMYDVLATYSDVVISHEVFMVKERNDIYGHREVIPSASKHGNKALSVSFGGLIKHKAQEYFDLLVKHQNHPDLKDSVKEWRENRLYRVRVG